MFRRLVVSGLLVVAGAAIAAIVPPVVRAQTTAADLFNDAVLQEIRISMNSKDLALLRLNYRNDTYYPADMTWNGIKVRNVGIRERGSGSRSPVKMGLHIEVDHYTTGQTFVGLPVLDLDNNFGDASSIRERLGMGLVARTGDPAPRESFGKIYLNNEYQGLYTIIEAYREPFLLKYFGRNDGFLFKFVNAFPFYGTYFGDALDLYSLFFKAEAHKKDPAVTLWGPIRDLFRDINGPDDGAWQATVDARLDLNQLMAQVGRQAFMAENDGVLGYAGMNNFFLYRYPGSDRHRLLEWDRDSCFWYPDTNIFLYADQNVLVTRALERPDLRTKFLDTVQQTAQLATQDNWLPNEIDRLFNIVSAAVLADTKKPFTNDQFLNEIAYLKLIASFRPNFVLDQVAKAR